MNTITQLFALFITCTLLNSCKKQEPQVQSTANVLTNGDFEASPYQDWISSSYKAATTNPNNYSVVYTTDAASSPTHSIKISLNASPSDTTFHVFQQVINQTTKSIPTGAKLTLKVKIKTANLQGNGVSLVIGGNRGGDANYAPTFYTSTEGKISIVGTNDFKEYSLTFDALPANTSTLYVALFYLPKTTGTVYYDDVSLSVN
ncbi:hypothetical protein [Spirosoma radiotolerans]|uniref:Uncharacterized protein n=1 Tax=Spirosoma radiotolerans TaxID=1379870 RepID=A0A0E3ZW09_9BACT|nr:hypothetical protein [Spirosoma radiotolerans]AKD55438.1 hypothetical protein SD10_11515 [Spirosoma radiotolerans]